MNTSDIRHATDEPELWHKPFQRNAYLKAHAIKMVSGPSPRPSLSPLSLVLALLIHPTHYKSTTQPTKRHVQQRMHRYLLQLHRASATFPKDLKEWEQGMMQAYASIIRRLQRTVEACLHEALARLMCLKRRYGRGWVFDCVGGTGGCLLLLLLLTCVIHRNPSQRRLVYKTHTRHDSSRINAVTTPKKATPLMGPTTPTGQALAAALNGWGENGGDDDDDAYLPARIPCVNLFDVRQEFSDVQEVGFGGVGVGLWRWWCEGASVGAFNV